MPGSRKYSVKRKGEKKFQAVNISPKSVSPLKIVAEKKQSNETPDNTADEKKMGGGVCVRIPQSKLSRERAIKGAIKGEIKKRRNKKEKAGSPKA